MRAEILLCLTMSVVGGMSKLQPIFVKYVLPSSERHLTFCFCKMLKLHMLFYYRVCFFRFFYSCSRRLFDIYSFSQFQWIVLELGNDKYSMDDGYVIAEVHHTYYRFRLFDKILFNLNSCLFFLFHN